MAFGTGGERAAAIGPVTLSSAPVGRSTLSGTQPRTATVSAFVIHGSGNADFLVVLEQPDQEAQR